VARHIDLVVANSADAIKAGWKEQTNAFDEAVKHYAGPGFSSAEARAGAVDRIIHHPDSPAHAFTSRMKESTIFGYYGSEIGLLKELDYKGNEVMAMFSGCGR
jgi:hypothetical protein